MRCARRRDGSARRWRRWRAHSTASTSTLTMRDAAAAFRNRDARRHAPVIIDP
jgi:hypothetical protein